MFSPSVPCIYFANSALATFFFIHIIKFLFLQYEYHPSNLFFIMQSSYHNFVIKSATPNIYVYMYVLYIHVCWVLHILDFLTIGKGLEIVKSGLLLLMCVSMRVCEGKIW